MMTTYYFCRHGQTENNKNKRLSGWHDTPLTEIGLQEAAMHARKLQGLSFDKIMSSDLGRAFTTAYIISRAVGYNNEIERRPELREANYGDLTGWPYLGDAAGYPDLTPEENTNYIPPNGESQAQMQDRVLACIEQTSAANPDKTILIVAHSGTYNALLSSFSGKPIGVVDAEFNDTHDVITKIIFDDGKIVSFDTLS